MTPKFRKQAERDITKPIPLPARLDPIAPIAETKFKDHQPIAMKENKLKPPRRKYKYTPTKGGYNQGTL